MRLRSLAASFPPAALVAVLVGGVPASAQQPDKPAAKPEVFGLTKVWQIHITMTAKEYDAMQPPPGAGGGFGGFGGFGGQPMGKQPEKKPGDRETHRSVFGTEFPVAHAAISTDGHTAENVAIRYKGNSTYLATARGLKRSFKIDVNDFDPKQKFLGLKTLNLHCGVHDPSRVREALAYEVFRAAGVPAPRTAFAEVTLTVPGKYEKEYVGLYTFTEQVNKPFLKAHYKTDAGLLMKPERVRSLDYLGEDWERYQNTYQPKRDATREEIARVLAFLKLVNQGSDGQFAREIGNYLDVDAFLKFLAANSLVSNLDSFFTNGHNYYLYLHPETKKFHFIPWDTDLSMGNFAFFGTPEQQMDLSLTKPYVQNRLADRLMAMKDVSAKYQAVAKELAATAFARDRLLKQVEAVEAVTRPLMAKEAKAVAARREGGGFGGAGAFGATPPSLKTFVEKRVESVAAQLAGKSQGYAPQAQGFGFGGPGGGFGGGGPGNPLARPLFQAMDGNRDGKASEAEFNAAMKKFFSEWDKDRSGTLDQQEVTDGLQKLAPPPKKGGFPGGMGGPGGGPFGPPPAGPAGPVPPPRPKGE
jgi:spore coat protein CotH